MKENTIGIIGAGTMGGGVARTVAARGITGLIKEKDETALARALAAIEAGLDLEIARWSLTDSEKRAILSRIHGILTLEELADVPFIIGCLPESLPEMKALVWAELNALCDPATIFISNTSTLSVTELASASGRPDRFIGGHFLYPVPKRPLVELVRGLDTSDDTYRKVKAFVLSLKKDAIEVFESPGYVTTRVILPLLNEAMHVVLEGVATADDVDEAMKLGYSFDQGPLEMSDRMGLDEVLAWMQHLFQELGELKYRPCPILRKMVRAGHLGTKTGQGFFRYDSEGRRIREDSRA